MVSSPESFPFLVVGNKLDLEADQRAVSHKQLEKMCFENGAMLCTEASAKSNLNVELAFTQLAELALKRQNQM
jgi:GTPase SAR1 family protein